MKNSIKNIKLKLFPVLLLSILFLGCEDYLTVEPKGVVSPTNVDQLGQLLIGDFQYRFGPKIIFMMGDDFTISNEVYAPLLKRDKNAYRWVTAYEPGDTDLDYRDYYASLYSANYVLDLIDDAALDGESEARKANVKAEALTLRGYCYLQMVNIYGAHYNTATSATDMALPLVLSAQPTQLPRSSVEDIYNQIESDLLASLDLYSDNLLNPVRTDNTRPAALALLARMYLYKGEWDQALTYSTAALDSYSALYNYNNFTKQNSEEVKNTREDENIESVFYRTGSAGYASGSNIVTLSNNLSSLFDSNDLRFDFFLEADGNGNYIYNPTNNPNGINPYTGIQTPELYLIKAESNARLGNLNAAMDDLALLRANRIDRSAYATQADFDNAVLLTPSNNTEAIAFVTEERRRELMFQNLRWYDMKRYIVLGEYTPTITRTVAGETYSLIIGSDQWVVDISPDNKDFNPQL